MEFAVGSMTAWNAAMFWLFVCLTIYLGMFSIKSFCMRDRMWVDYTGFTGVFGFLTFLLSPASPIRL